MILTYLKADLQDLSQKGWVAYLIKISCSVCVYSDLTHFRLMRYSKTCLGSCQSIVYLTLPYLTTCLGCISISFVVAAFLFQLQVDSLRKEGRSVFGIQLWIKAVQQVVVLFVAGAREFFSPCKASGPALGPSHPH